MNVPHAFSTIQQDGIGSTEPSNSDQGANLGQHGAAFRRIPYPTRAPLSDTLALVLAGGRGSRLGALTERCAKPALPIAGKCRIIDFALSNCLNSGVPRVGVLTQYMEHSLIPHLRAWASAAPSRDFSIRILPARNAGGYLGTADAVYQNRDLIRALSPSYVLVLAADHVYKMDYAAMLADHLRRGADITIGCVEVTLEEARNFGVMAIDPDRRVRHFVEKPQAPEPMPGGGNAALASMGIYIFNTGVLLEALESDAASTCSSHDFGKDIIPAAIASGRVYAHSFRDPRHPDHRSYWRDVGTVDAYWRTSMDLAGAAPALSLQDKSWPIRTVGLPSPAVSGDVAINASIRYAPSPLPGAATDLTPPVSVHSDDCGMCRASLTLD